jgi:hypothetical protein
VYVPTLCNSEKLRLCHVCWCLPGGDSRLAGKSGWRDSVYLHDHTPELRCATLVEVIQTRSCERGSLLRAYRQVAPRSRKQTPGSEQRPPPPSSCLLLLPLLLLLLLLLS